MFSASLPNNSSGEGLPLSDYDRVPIFAYLLVKLASRCNLDCSYCYWFRDPTVYHKPKIMGAKVVHALCTSLERHINKFSLDEFTVLLHGGEPLLFGKKQFRDLLSLLDGVATRTRCKITNLLSTNGALIDDEWALILNQGGVHVSVSIDGPEQIHDARRKDLSGRGSHARACRGLELLRKRGVDVGIISVCDPTTDASVVADYIAHVLNIKRFDILPPDATHSDHAPSIARYYTQLFDTWHTRLGPAGIDIRIVSGIVRGLFGRSTETDSIGYGPVHTVTILTDGQLEALDVLRIAGPDTTRTRMNIFENELQDVGMDPDWRRAYDASLKLPQQCKECDFRDACGGGHLAHRWSRERGFDNPSVYCEDYKTIFRHAWDRLLPGITVHGRRGKSVPLVKVLS
jgi:uncharacterized protein